MTNINIMPQGEEITYIGPEWPDLQLIIDTILTQNNKILDINTRLLEVLNRPAFLVRSNINESTNRSKSRS